MTRRATACLGFLVLATGCAPSLEGNWEGQLTCGQIPFEFSFLMSETSKRLYEGQGLKYRIYENLNGNVIEEFDEFDLTLERQYLSGEQDMIAIIDCTRKDVSVDNIFDETIDCLPQQWADYGFAWDGDVKMDVAGPDCVGSVTKASAGGEDEE